MRLPDASVAVDLDDHTAHMRERQLRVEDYFNLINAFKDGESAEASVSYQVWWSGVLDRSHISDDENDFTANLVQDTVKIQWQATSRGALQVGRQVRKRVRRARPGAQRGLQRLSGIGGARFGSLYQTTGPPSLQAPALPCRYPTV